MSVKPDKGPLEDGTPAPDVRPPDTRPLDTGTIVEGPLPVDGLLVDGPAVDTHTGDMGCGQAGDTCTVDADCCSNRCFGPPGGKTCKP